MAWEMFASGQVPSKSGETEIWGAEGGAGGRPQRPGRWSVLATEHRELLALSFTIL